LSQATGIPAEDRIGLTTVQGPLEARQIVFGCSVASWAVALLRTARVDRGLLPAVAAAPPAKHGLRMLGTAISVVIPAN
jgi:hypothetical protein